MALPRSACFWEGRGSHPASRGGRREQWKWRLVPELHLCLQSPGFLLLRWRRPGKGWQVGVPLLSQPPAPLARSPPGEARTVVVAVGGWFRVTGKWRKTKRWRVWRPLGIFLSATPQPPPPPYSSRPRPTSLQPLARGGAAVDGSLPRHARGLAGSAPQVAPGPGRGRRSGAPEPSEPGCECWGVGGAVCGHRRLSPITTILPGGRLPRMAGPPERGAVSRPTWRRGVGAALVTAAPRVSGVGAAGTPPRLGLGAPLRMLAGSPAVLSCSCSLEHQSAGRQRRGHVCAFCWK